MVKADLQFKITSPKGTAIVTFDNVRFYGDDKVVKMLGILFHNIEYKKYYLFDNAIAKCKEDLDRLNKEKLELQTTRDVIKSHKMWILSTADRNQLKSLANRISEINRQIEQCNYNINEYDISKKISANELHFLFQTMLKTLGFNNDGVITSTNSNIIIISYEYPKEDLNELIKKIKIENEKFVKTNPGATPIVNKSNVQNNVVTETKKEVKTKTKTKLSPNRNNDDNLSK